MFTDGVRSQEVGLVGVALPVSVDLTIPSQHREPHDPNAVKFGECGVGSSTQATVQLTNRSTDLPVTFQFRRIAHFACQPMRGCLQPGHSTYITVTFTPRQMGSSCCTVVLELCLTGHNHSSEIAGTKFLELRAIIYSWASVSRDRWLSYKSLCNYCAWSRLLIVFCQLGLSHICNLKLAKSKKDA